MSKIKVIGTMSMLGMLVGCGGGSDNKDHYQSAGLTPVELAQVAAAIQSAKTTFDVVAYDGLAIISSSIKEGDVNKNISCRSGSYRVSPNLKTQYVDDGLLVNNNCMTNTSKWDGAIELECIDAKCEKSITTATGAVWGDRQRNVDLTINGEMLSDALTDGFKGYASIEISGKKTNFDFTNAGLVQKYYNNGLIDGFGQLNISYGGNNRCIDGTYGYDITSDLILEQNSARVLNGKMAILDHKNRELGTVQFERDGGVSVQNTSGARSYISASQFESYCGLSEAYRFSTY